MNLKHDAQECMHKGLLRKIPPSQEKAEASNAAAKQWLEEAEKNIKNKAHHSSILSSYLGMFHAARAILFRDGIREKSHYCIARYLEEEYVKKKKLELQWVELLDHYREIRHNNQYSLHFFASPAEAESTLLKAKEFAERMKRLLKEKKEEGDTENGREADKAH